MYSEIVAKSIKYSITYIKGRLSRSILLREFSAVERFEMKMTEKK